MTIEEFKSEVDRVFAGYTAEILEAGAKFALAIDELAAKSSELPESSRELVPSILALREKRMETEIMASSQ